MTAQPRLRIGYPDGGVEIMPLPAGPCVDERKAHDWTAATVPAATIVTNKLGHPDEREHPGLIAAARAECAVCHAGIGRTFDPPVAGAVKATIV